MNVVIIGAQWGDEGKGKIVDYLAEDADYVVRYAGGPNAGHTIVVGGKQFALHQVPSGILYPNKTVFLGSGMVIDAEALFAELQMLKDNGINWEGRVFRFILHERLVFRDEMFALHPIGTTGRGMGIAYAEKAYRDGVRLADLDWAEKMSEFDGEDKEYLDKYRDSLIKMRVNLTAKLFADRKMNFLFEGAQGAMLDLDAGTYPYVSSGMSCAAGAACGSGIGPKSLDKVLGVFKAYTTRVGNGPLPTEFDENSQSELYRFVRETGREYGVTTGRPRRCGYLDLVALRYACRTNSLDGLVLTHLDIYDTLDEIEACTAYDIDGHIVTDFPANIEELNRAKPVLEKFTGWKKELKGTQDYDQLPREARKYVEFIEAYTETPVDIISVGYERNDTFIRKPVWE